MRFNMRFLKTICRNVSGIYFTLNKKYSIFNIIIQLSDQRNYFNDIDLSILTDSFLIAFVYMYVYYYICLIFRTCLLCGIFGMLQ